ncbi:hypothetical protein ACFYXM_24375 [Streptomyces sp. NPDC002476]|uniref:hypothetical protein n=1 Tax=Streptomyces sp. NPDC002476 TaxID=3364648 RepID=UPI0036825BB3
MTHDHLTTATATLTARAEYHTDWHVCIDDPARGPLGYCTGTGPDEPFDPDAANRVLEQGGWRVTGPWTVLVYLLGGQGAIYERSASPKWVMRVLRRPPSSRACASRASRTNTWW